MRNNLCMLSIPFSISIQTNNLKWNEAKIIKLIRAHASY
jgi:hypothetical protein